MTCILRDKIYVPVDSIGRYINDLVKLFTYSNPEYFEKQRMGFSVNKISPYMVHYGFQTINNIKYLLLPRGGWTKLKNFCTENKLLLKTCDERKTYPQINVELAPGTTLESQQHAIIETLLREEGGLIEASPGAGKTISMLGLIAELKQPTLILMHEHRLRTQWEEEIKQRLQGNFTLGRCDGDKKVDGDIVVALIQSIYNQFHDDPTYISKFGCVITDECHHVPASMYNLVINNIPAKYRIGVTGTVERKDGKHVLLHDVIGPTLIKIDAQDIKHRITSFKPKMIETEISFNAPTCRRWTGGKVEEKIDYTKLLTCLVTDTKRNLLILENIVNSIKEGYFPLILSDRVDHCNLLYSHLVDLGFNTVLLTGATRKKTKWEQIRKDDTVQAIVAQSSIAAEGLDFPKLSAIHLTCPSTNMPKLKQKIGRIRRVCENKPMPVVYDYVDNRVALKLSNSREYYPLQRGGKSRLHFYNKLKDEYED